MENQSILVGFVLLLPCLKPQNTPVLNIPGSLRFQPRKGDKLRNVVNICLTYQVVVQHGRTMITSCPARHQNTL